DINGDGVIDSDDRLPYGYPDYPFYQFGLNIDLGFKNIFFSMQWVGATNVSRSLSGKFQMPFDQMSDNGVLDYFWDKRWTPETASTATFPRLTYLGAANNGKSSDFWTIDASYIRLKAVELGYNFNTNGFLSRLGIQDFKVV